MSVWAFNIKDRGFGVRASYDVAGENAGYRIWNIAAHFHDYVNE